MLSYAAAQDIIRMAKRAGEEIAKQVEPRYEIDTQGWTYEFCSRYHSHLLRICCYWQAKPGSMKVDDESDEAYWAEMKEMDRQYQLIQDLLNAKIAKSKYAKLNVEAQFSAGI
tara:strand:+ start:381066 stop:381404 length:339 start_codon:yes stop_codon:yes gene_type:complete